MLENNEKYFEGIKRLNCVRLSNFVSLIKIEISKVSQNRKFKGPSISGSQKITICDDICDDKRSNRCVGGGG